MTTIAKIFGTLTVAATLSTLVIVVLAVIGTPETLTMALACGVWLVTVVAGLTK